ncbi:MAG: aminotransferase class III-fold pyridoxal phosphate-dependent enzyme [Myxococcales bacterium]|nr:aminotransferase class III-fold pyridoxal phosphate-dependent enzyme [Myxococcales bacterium]MCB9520510.1 aminotransferase class III-fold pyridoxal phosphate-dependent enzyme [Myxococcales bacterium]
MTDKPNTMKALIQEHIHSSAHLSKKHVHPKMLKLFELGGFNAVYDRAEGHYLYDTDGNKYLDLLSGGGVYLLGRNNERIHGALRDVLELDVPNLTIVNASILSGLLAERLLALAGPHYTKCLFSNTGSEATDLAIRFARFATGKRRMLYLEGAFHGRTYADVSICGSPELRRGMEPLMPICTPVRPNDTEQLERELSKGDVAGFFFEPVQGMSGRVLTPEYLRAAERMCNEHGALLCADEVQTGLCRTGPWFASLAAGVRPHMVWVSKILSGGTVPVSALMMTQELYDQIYAGFTSGPVYFSTFAENNLAMAAGLANLELLVEMNAPERATALGEVLRGGLEALAERYDVIDRIEGQGLLQVVYFRDSAQLGLKLQQSLMRAADPAAFGAAVNVDLYKQKRIIVQVPGATLNAIKILPPVTLTEEDVEWFLEGLEDVIASYYAERAPIVSVSKGFLSTALKGLRSAVPPAFLPPILSGIDAPTEKKNAEPLRRHHPGITRFEDYDRDIDEHCDVLVVGGGPSGAIAARQAALAGKRVILVEAGPVAEPESFNDDCMDMFNRFYWDSGLRTTRGNVVLPTLTIRALGGGSVFNSAICLRMPEYQVRRWRREHGIDISVEEMAPHYEEVEALMGIAPTPEEVQGTRNVLFKQGCDNLGISSAPINRNVSGCKGSARCVVGCPNHAKNTPDFRVIPEILDLGGRVLSSVHVDSLIMRGNRCAGVVGWVAEPGGARTRLRVRITAKATILAAGCLHSPTIMQRSGIKNPVIGKNFRTHPGIYALGEYEQVVNPWIGATQGYHSLQYLEDGIKLESLWVNAPLIAARIPGIGHRYKEGLANYRHMGVFDAWVSGDDSSGHVRALPGGGKDLAWTMGLGDVRRLKEATALLADLHFAAGAHTVYTGLLGEHNTLYGPDDVSALRAADLGPKDFTCASQHLFGTTPMGADKDRHVVDSHGAVYGVDGLFVADTGIMPVSPAANPMHPVMALANRIGKGVAAGL